MVDFSLNRPLAVDFSLQSVANDQNRPPTVDFWRNHPVADSPRTGNLTDRYVPPVPSGTGRNCKPWFKLQTKVFRFELYRAVHTDVTGYRYADRPLPGGTVETGVSPQEQGDTSSPCAGRGNASSSSERTRRCLFSPYKNKASPCSLAASFSREMKFHSMFAILTCTARYGRYILIRQVAGTRTASYQAIISAVGGLFREKSSRLREKKGRRRRRGRGKEEKRRGEEESVILARTPSPPSPAHHRRASALARFFSRAWRKNFSRAGRKIISDIGPFSFLF
ncbi:hypothetical protein BHM03_00054006 [Ensete ventricosum]|uniref:Uncharacterized protein n=1 Tax=Ensete ventricosum TaxID=4639 RepID=A0A445MM27_ENSVE|nr:hypothetical protein BHM03_00054006 [Ensete ventricosum]